MRPFSYDTAAELFPAATIGFSLPADPGQVPCNIPQHLIPGIMPERIVEFLEMINIDHGDAIRLAQRSQRFIERATPRQSGQFIVIGDPMRTLDHRNPDR